MEIERFIDNLIKENRAKMGLGFSRYILSIGIILTLVGGGGWLFFPVYTQLLVFSGILILITIAAGLYPFFYRRNQIKRGALLLCAAIFLGTTVIVFLLPELIPGAGIAYLAVIIIGNLLLDESESRWFNLATVVALALILIWARPVAAYWFEPLDEMLGTIFNLVVSLGCLVVVIFIVSLLVRKQEDQFRQAQKARLELEAAVEKYGEHMAGVAQGNLSARLALDDNQEVLLTQLGHNINGMVDKLNRQIKAEQQSRLYIEQAIVPFIEQVATGDLTARLAINSQRDDDILTNLGHNLNNMVEGLGRITAQIREATVNIASAAAEILAAATQQAAGASEQSAAISQTSTTIDEVKTIVDQAFSKAQAVAEQAQRTSDISQTGQQGVTDTIEGMNQIKEKVEGIAENILALSEQTQQIGEITATVNEIASQSNLLALNASVEAARAGEYGKGFAVVAFEVRNLAEQSKQATAQVKAILNEIQRATNAAVMATEEGTKGVDAGVQLTDQTGETIQQLAGSIAENANAAHQIVASAQQQTTGIEQIALAMQSINQATIQNIASVHQTERAAQDLSGVAQQMEALVAQYKLS